MLLLDSRSPLVTATCSVKSRHPFYRRYGANLPISLGWVNPTRLGLLTQGHLCRFSVRSPGRPFHGLQGSAEPLMGPITLSPSSRHYGTPRAYTLRQRGSAARPTPKRRARFRGLRPGGAGILTGFPFGGVELRATLGPANPRLTNMAEET